MKHVIEYAACNSHVKEHVMHVMGCNYTVITEHYMLLITLHALQAHYMHVMDM